MLSNNITLRILKEQDYTNNYLRWFSDPEVVKYSQNRFKTFSKIGQLEYIRSFLEDDKKFLYGIFFKEKHIGNIELNEIDNQKLTANITYIIGEREYWGKGIASYCINQILKKAKVEFALKKICAGCASKNIASIRVLKKNNFEVELIKRGFFIYDDEMMDCIIFKRLI